MGEKCLQTIHEVNIQNDQGTQKVSIAKNSPQIISLKMDQKNLNRHYLRQANS